MADQPMSNKKRQFSESSEDSIMRWRSQYESELELDPNNYDAWLEYIQLEVRDGDRERVQEIFERAIANVPIEKKRFWQSYVTLWLDYALFQEFEVKDVEKARDVYSRCIQLIPHERFSFPKVWISAAKLEIHQSNFKNARLLLESALERAPSREIFTQYIFMEQQLGNIKRCHMLYMRYVQWSPDEDYDSWIEYIEFERSHLNPKRARFLYEIAISQPALYKSGPLWYSYIEFEMSEGEFARVSELYERLLERVKHVNVWIEYAKFEASLVNEVLQDDEEEEEVEDDERFNQKKKKVMHVEACVEKVRHIFRKAMKYYRNFTRSSVEIGARVKLLEEWEILERGFGSYGDVNVLDQFSASDRMISGGIVLS